MSPTASTIHLIARESPTAVVVGFSGGMDSTALLHLLANDATVRACGLRALHVHHGLHPDADAWAEHCQRVCAALGIACDVVRVTVERGSGLGPEASARQARRKVFAQALHDNESLALAQHRDDQAETFLLRALRASGPDGLASMRPWRRFASGWMWRPLLDTPREALLVYVRANGLAWIEDPSNADVALDRNFLRHRVLPLLRERWPQADAAFARAAMLAAEGSDLLGERDPVLLALVREEVGAALSATALRGLGPAKRARALRHWVATLGWPPLPAEGIARIETDLLHATSADSDADRMPRFAWHGVEIRRWRDGLHAIEGDRALPQDWSCHWDGREPLALPNGDRFALHGAPVFPTPLLAHARRGGERILRQHRDGHHHALKHVLQELEIAPWDRARMPLLSTADGLLLAAGDRVYSAGFGHWLESQNARLEWIRA